ncbi:MAG TPA: hypothetical protein VKM55_12485 [Candidatus Lokiarchaeia archaeon]|nr:hypothetical protein [Candidatus Lokiarchaeia archaeon]
MLVDSEILLEADTTLVAGTDEEASQFAALFKKLRNVPKMPQATDQLINGIKNLNTYSGTIHGNEK